MEISARVLREVEFNSSLRGYNTDEVDEFLEQVADGVDRLQAEAKTAAERAETAERAAQDHSGHADEESIKRTLVLAQRTADLAIREAQEEAGQILDLARGEAETLVGDARDSAERISSDAERRLHEDVARLTGSRDALKTEVDTLVSLLGAERDRLTETLGAALRYVERSLSPSSPLMSLQSASADREPAVPAATTDDVTEPDDGSDADDTADDVADGATEAYTIVARPDGESPTEAAPVVATAAGESDDEQDDGTVTEMDDLEAAIAEDAAAAAPGPAQRVEPESDQYDWDSVIRGKSEPFFNERPQRVERTNLTSLPALDDSSPETTSAQIRVRPAD